MLLSFFFVKGVTFRPHHRRYSVVTGLRIYPANNNPGADPVWYTLQGRSRMGVKIKDAAYNMCWYADSSYYIKFGDCSNSSDEYLFYTNMIGEIRSVKYNWMCVDPTYYTSTYSRLVTCHSYYYGEDNSSTDMHKFTFDTQDGGGFVIKPDYLSGYCMDHHLELGDLYAHGCHGGANQKFFVASEGRWDVSVDDDWIDIAGGNLPWVSMEERNALGQAIYSTDLAADANKYVMEVGFPHNIGAYYEYKVTFPELRDPDSLQVQFSEMELPGIQLYLGDDGGTQVSLK